MHKFDLSVLYLGRLVQFLRSEPWHIPSSGRRRAFGVLHAAFIPRHLMSFSKIPQSAQSMRKAPGSFPPPATRPPCLLKLIRPPAPASVWQLAREWLKMQVYLCALCLFSPCFLILIPGE